MTSFLLLQTMSAQLRNEVCHAFGDALLHADILMEPEDEGLHLTDLPDLTPVTAPSQDHTLHRGKRTDLLTPPTASYITFQHWTLDRGKHAVLTPITHCPKEHISAHYIPAVAIIST